MGGKLSDWAIWGCYALFGGGVVLTLTVGPDTLLSIDWTLSLFGNVLARLWAELPLIPGLLLVALGIFIGTQVEKRGPKT